MKDTDLLDSPSERAAAQGGKTAALGLLYMADLAQHLACKRQIAETFPRLARGIRDDRLRDMVEAQARRAWRQSERLGHAVEGGPTVPDAAIAAMLARAEGWSEELTDPVALDTAMASAASRILAYEAAAAATLSDWAGTLGRREEQALILGFVEDCGIVWPSMPTAGTTEDGRV